MKTEISAFHPKVSESGKVIGLIDLIGDWFKLFFEKLSDHIPKLDQIVGETHKFIIDWDSGEVSVRGDDPRRSEKSTSQPIHSRDKCLKYDIIDTQSDVIEGANNLA